MGKWLKRSNSSHLLLSTNDKTVKLWRVFEKKVTEVSNTNLEGKRDSSLSKSVSVLKVPRILTTDTVVAATPRRVYANAHAYHINSISVCSDGETFLSADDLRVNLWNLELSSQTFEEREDPSKKSFFSEIISSVSDARFSRDGRYIIARDYLTLKLYDVNMDSQPLRTIHIHEHLSSRLCELYETDSIFDKFEVSVSCDGSSLMTGSYGGLFKVYDWSGKTEHTLEASRNVQRKSKKGLCRQPLHLPRIVNLTFHRK